MNYQGVYTFLLEVSVMTYFKNIETLEQLRKAYKDLLKKYHPDNGGSEEIMKAINVEYEQLFKLLKNRHESKATGTESNTSENVKWNFEEDEKIRYVLNKIIHFSDITCEICGTWIWLSGNTYQYRKELKEFGFKFASNKKMWFWHLETYVKKSRKSLSMDDIRSYYGSTEVKTENKKQLATA